MVELTEYFYIDINGTFCEIVDGDHFELVGVEIFGDQKLIGNDPNYYHFLSGKKSAYDVMRHGKVCTYQPFYKFTVILN